MTPNSKAFLRTTLAFCALLTAAGHAGAQSTSSAPVTDSAAQASPVGPALKAPATDDSAQASPVASDAHGGAAIPAKTTLKVSLTEGIDSGNLQNGKNVHGKLAADVPLSKNATGKRAMLRAGTPAVLTVVSTVPAGKLNAVGEISLELVHVGNVAVESEVLTFRGTPGHRDLPDSAPEVGTNAGLPVGMTLTFHSLPTPQMADSAHRATKAPGSVTAVVSGSQGTSQTGGSGEANSGVAQPAGTAQPH